MSDTFPDASWAFASACTFPHSERSPSAQVVDYWMRIGKLTRDAKENGNLIDGVILSRFRQVHDLCIPDRGIAVADLIAQLGNVDELTTSCTDCPAAVRQRLDSGRLPGCHGFLNRVTGEFLTASIERAELGSRIDCHFPRTDPIWFGLWIESPLSMEQCDDLRILMSVWLDMMRDDPEVDREDWEAVGAFRAALEAANSGRIPLYVEYGVPGHVDMGWYTVFPHCPRCKAQSPCDEWRSEEWPTHRVICLVCGHSYRVQETASQRPDEPDDNSPPDPSRFQRPLSEHFGCEGEDALIARYLRGQGRSDADVQRALRAVDPMRSI